MNKSDSERIAAILDSVGFKSTPKENEADLIVVNACSVRQSAVDRIFGQAQKFSGLKKKNPKFKTFLLGCVLPSDKIKFRKLFDFVIATENITEIPRLLGICQKAPRESDYYFKIKPKHQSPFSAFVPIMTGCNNFCSYCAVPYTRGREISRPAEDIVCEIKELIEHGYKEIWLLGQNVNSYKAISNMNKFLASESKYKKSTLRQSSGLMLSKTEASNIINFSTLLMRVDKIPGKFWIRFTSPHPKDFSDELIETMAKSKKVAPYLNLPAQSGDDEILKKMNRPYTVNHYKKLVIRIRNAFKKYREGVEKDIAISTDTIVGFPGESKKQFDNTIKLYKEIAFDMAYIAQYSPRPETAAAKFNDNVSKKEKTRRWKILTDILRNTALENNKKYTGKIVEVLIDESRIMNQESRVFFGKTASNKTVKIHNSLSIIHNSNLIGKFVKVKVTEALPWGLKGKLINER